MKSNVFQAIRQSFYSQIGWLAVALAGFTSPLHANDNVPPSREPWQSGFHGSPDPPMPLVLERAYPKLSFKGPTSLHRIPNEERFIVLEHWGKIFSFVDREQPTVPISALILQPNVHPSRTVCQGTSIGSNSIVWRSIQVLMTTDGFSWPTSSMERKNRSLISVALN